MSSPIRKGRHDPSIRQFLDPVARGVEVPGSVLHFDKKLGSVGLHAMLPPVQRTTIENRIPRVLVQDASPHGVMVSTHESCPERLNVSITNRCQ